MIVTALWLLAIQVVIGAFDNLYYHEWRARLTPQEFQVLRQHGTERAWTGCFVGTKEPGTYVCAGCHNPLFPSGEKFESGTGWPSFTQTISQDAVTEITDRTPLLFRHRGIDGAT